MASRYYGYSITSGYKDLSVHQVSLARGLTYSGLLLSYQSNLKVSVSASVCIYLFTDAFLLSILLFCLLVSSLDDFSYPSYTLLLAFSAA